ncbi:sigma factor-like helix-turn-helix DNA-binding protein [Amycolatopsis sp. lyj-23]|uniref:sigma factor-like helix-turn-helix DNA-binding protein n=1 Tax=Amycolatopsis sp. lyj-23 TaxID=2789283 RepID=UPI00397E219E
MFVQDRSAADVARRLGVPQSTIKRRAHRLLRSCKRLLDRKPQLDDHSRREHKHER